MKSTYTPTALQVASVHTTVASAVAAARMDLSYNPEVAADAIRRWDQPYSGDRKLSEFQAAYVMEDRTVWVQYVICAENLIMLRKFTPFHGMLSDGPLTVYRKNTGGKFEFVAYVKNNKAERRATALAGHIVVG